MGILLWIIFGAIAGWIASKFAGTDAQQGWLGNIIVGIIGAVVGGFLASFLGFSITGFNLGSLIIAIIGAFVVTLAYQALTKRKTAV